MNIRLVWLVGFVAVACGCMGEQPEAVSPGFLEGSVSIGPLCPVEPCNIPPERLAEVYASRSVIVSWKDTGKVVAVVSLNADGSYRVALPPGVFVVDTNRTGGVGGARGLPADVVIESNKTVRLDIDIDTGIR
jgi:hypothetical protein